MINPTEEDIKVLNSEVEACLATLDKEKKEIQEDLKEINSSSLSGKICDFGCGSGFTTYCLASLINLNEVVGVDNNPTSINRATQWFEKVKLYARFATEKKLSDDLIVQESKHLLGISKHPKFIVGDVVSGKNLPLGISLTYCRRLLVNIAHGKYEDSLLGIDRTRLAIKNMVNATIYGGWFIAVEESSGGNFSQLLEEEGLKRVNTIPFQSKGIVPYIRYIYRKLS